MPKTQMALTKRSKKSLKYSKSANDPWLLATNLPTHRTLSKQVVGIYRQRMQIEEGFRDMKSSANGVRVTLEQCRLVYLR